MYKTLIVDDEAYVVDYLIELLEGKDRYEMDIYSARTVGEALLWLERTKIDIIITDIRMPGMSGIELAERVKLTWPQCKVIILSAHAEFNYAFEAIKNNVIGYILKTEDDERILEEVDRAVRLIGEEMKSEELLDQTKKYVEDSFSIIRKDLLLRLLKEEDAIFHTLFDELQTVGCKLSVDRKFILFAGRMENNLNIGVIDRFTRTGLLCNFVYKYFSPNYYCEYIEYAQDKFMWLLQPKEVSQEINEEEMNREKWHVFFEGILDTIQQAFMASCGTCISFALNGEWLKVSQLSGMFRYLDYVLKQHHSDNVGFVVTDFGMTFTEIEPQDYSLKQMIFFIVEKLRVDLENGNQSAFMEGLDRVCSKLGEFSSLRNTMAWEIYNSVAGVIISFMNQRNLVGKVSEKIGIQVLLSPQLADGWIGVAKFFRHISEVIFAIQDEHQRSTSNNIIQFLKHYIDEHITQDVSLVKLSEVTGYSNAYLSKIFKKKTGESINDYITRKKIELIKELMKDEHLTIGEIANKAGFEYRTYFNRFVNKQTGMPPHEWRRNILIRSKKEGQ